MKRIINISIFFSVVGHGTAYGKAAYEGSSYNEVWDQVLSDPYDALPHTKVTLRSFYHFFNNKLAESADRTLNDRNDLLPHFDKLVHPTGICLAGTWEITEDSPYTGYFRKGSQALIIARASEAMGNTSLGDYRSFGLAGKLYPTKEKSQVVKTANFFTVDDLGGTEIEDFTKTALLNEPELTLWGRRPHILAIGAATARAFRAADANPNIRPLYPIAELEEQGPIKAPKWLLIKGAPSISRFQQHVDFRDDLRLTNYLDDLEFEIYVADPDTDWLRLGSITFDVDALSESCDHRLHFSHPKSR